MSTNAISARSLQSLPLPYTLTTQQLLSILKKDDAEALELALKEDPNLKTSIDMQGRTSLHLACELGASSCARALILAGADCDAKDNLGNRPLEGMILHGGDFVNCANVLLPEMTYISALNATGESILHLAAAENRVGIIETLIAHYFTVDTRNRAGETPLHKAAQNNCPQAIELLLQLQADKNAVDKHGFTSLHWASAQLTPNCTRQLLKGGADHTIMNKNGETPLHLAVHFYFPECVKLLLGAQANPDALSYRNTTPLTEAILLKNKVVALAMVEAGAGVDRDGNTLFHLGNPLFQDNGTFVLDLIKFIINLRRTIDPSLLTKTFQLLNARNHPGDTPLQQAALQNRFDVGSVLIKAGADYKMPYRPGSEQTTEEWFATLTNSFNELFQDR